MPDLAPGFYDNTAPVLTFVGSWSADVSVMGAYQQTTHTTADPAAQLQAAFIGSGFTLYGQRGPLGADITLCIDATCTPIATYGDLESYGELVAVEGLTADRHTLTVQKSDSSATVLTLDALYVAPMSVPTLTPTSLTPEATPTSAPTLTPGAYEQRIVLSAGETAIVRYEMSGGDVAIFIVLVMVLAVVSMLFVRALWHR